MRPDQVQKIDELAERMVDVFTVEADPANWTGADVPATEMTPEVRGARNWDMKNANQAGALTMRLLDLRDRLRGVAAPHNPIGDDDAEAAISKYEKQAKKLLETVGARRGKA